VSLRFPPSVSLRDSIKFKTLNVKLYMIRSTEATTEYAEPQEGEDGGGGLQENAILTEESEVKGVAKSYSEVSLLRDESGASFKKQTDRVTYEVASGNIEIREFMSVEGSDWSGSSKVELGGLLVVNEGYVKMETERMKKEAAMADPEAAAAADAADEGFGEEVVAKPPVSFDVTVEFNSIENFLPQRALVEAVKEEDEEEASQTGSKK
jgi:hypothetical protein